MNNFIRESKDRTHSERLIDRHIISRYDEPELSKKAKITENASVSKSITFTEGFEKLKNNLKKKKFQTKLIQTFYKFLKAYATLLMETPNTEFVLYQKQLIFYTRWASFWEEELSYMISGECKPGV